MTRRIPITLISGYLGAGKTTLINHLLSVSDGQRIAVLVNDFGAINIDTALIKEQTDQAISLTNGCVCCSITDDLGDALDAQASRDNPPDLVVLEASGVADPMRLARHAGNWPGFELDAIVTLLDAETVQMRAQDKFVGQLIHSQIKAGDILVLTKSDIVSDDRCQDLRDWIARLSPTVSLITVDAGKIDPALLLGPSSTKTVSQRMENPREADNIATYHWIPSSPINKQDMADCLSLLPPTVHRVKGFFFDQETKALTLLQRVGNRLTFDSAPKGAEAGLVLIATGNKCDLENEVKTIAENLKQLAETARQ
ncbi:CobW family GTP-binding protein [Sneathiella marina]|uniref:CobW family GTP-binding protein n=1 Tax=Sneathiella marina TaxID=2950108 RepID=A0ABY4W9A3_9PROT|nr:CobW family GTP-binding protein [Sneathiella marina]USG62507.1 CobW family GTP-binding protein [Sneathiella marina]